MAFLLDESGNFLIDELGNFLITQEEPEPVVIISTAHDAMGSETFTSRVITLG